MAPNKQKYKKRKRTYRRRKRSTAMSAYSNMPFKKSQKVRFRYADIGINLDPGSGGAAASYRFSCNGLFDPDISGTGHQPSGFDQLVGVMYDHYTVIGATIKCTFVNNDTSNSQTVAINIRDNNTATVDIRVPIESGTCKWIGLGPAGSSRDTATLTYKVNPAKFLGRSHPMSDDQLKGTDAANPTEQCFFELLCAPTGALDAQACNVQTVIEYIAILTEPKAIGLS